MTRINVIDPSLLLNEHLVAELRELPRVPNAVLEGKAKIILDKIPKKFVLGEGHVKFFYNKLMFLKLRHIELRKEYFARNNKEYMNGEFKDIDLSPLENCLIKRSLCGTWEPDEDAIIQNVARIKERFDLRARAYHFGKTKINDSEQWNVYEEMLKNRYSFLK